MPVKISTTEWLAELDRLSKKDGAGGDPGATRHELAEALGVSLDKASQLIRSGIEAGRVLCGRRPQASIDGIPRRVPVYRVVAAKGKGR